ncbi:homeobox domain-containing protein [uncultured Endozoicomonas sp.]|uniref:homeobox domain-containing protein n=1 Tax=uncultured Endozoicomonas sp. TaxID=432652 RepID=UPI002637DF31|nr:homeobox domain-containing protein [uncultured Endozoicomonas sp.]
MDSYAPLNLTRAAAESSYSRGSHALSEEKKRPELESTRVFGSQRAVSPIRVQNTLMPWLPFSNEDVATWMKITNYINQVNYSLSNRSLAAVSAGTFFNPPEVSIGSQPLYNLSGFSPAVRDIWPASIPDTLEKRQRQPRTQFTKDQLKGLEDSFKEKKYPSLEDKELLAKRLGLSEHQVNNWFGNKRAKSKRAGHSSELKLRGSPSGECSRVNQSSNSQSSDFKADFHGAKFSIDKRSKTVFSPVNHSRCSSISEPSNCAEESGKADYSGFLSDNARSQTPKQAIEESDSLSSSP